MASTPAGRGQLRAPRPSITIQVPPHLVPNCTKQRVLFQVVTSTPHADAVLLTLNEAVAGFLKSVFTGSDLPYHSHSNSTAHQCHSTTHSSTVTVCYKLTPAQVDTLRTHTAGREDVVLPATPAASSFACRVTWPGGKPRYVVRFINVPDAWGVQQLTEFLETASITGWTLQVPLTPQGMPRAGVVEGTVETSQPLPSTIDLAGCGHRQQLIIHMLGRHSTPLPVLRATPSGYMPSGGAPATMADVLRGPAAPSRASSTAADMLRGPPLPCSSSASSCRDAVTATPVPAEALPPPSATSVVPTAPSTAPAAAAAPAPALPAAAATAPAPAAAAAAAAAAADTLSAAASPAAAGVAVSAALPPVTVAVLQSAPAAKRASQHSPVPPAQSASVLAADAAPVPAAAPSPFTPSVPPATEGGAPAPVTCGPFGPFHDAAPWVLAASPATATPALLAAASLESHAFSFTAAHRDCKRHMRTPPWRSTRQRTDKLIERVSYDHDFDDPRYLPPPGWSALLWSSCLPTCMPSECAVLPASVVT